MNVHQSPEEADVLAKSVAKGIRASKRAFIIKRLHSLTGVMPLGFFLVEHLWTNAHANEGQKAFITAVDQIQQIPFLPFVEVFGIFLPLLFHSVYGIVLARAGRPNALAYSYSRNWLYVLQRVSGIIAFAFIALHLWEFRVQKAFFGMSSESFYDVLAAHLSATKWGVPWNAFLYMTGLLAVVFHFANGLQSFGITWGITATKKAQSRSAWIFTALGVFLFVLGAQTILHFATGARFLSGSPGM